VCYSVVTQRYGAPFFTEGWVECISKMAANSISRRVLPSPPQGKVYPHSLFKSKLDINLISRDIKRYQELDSLGLKTLGGILKDGLVASFASLARKATLNQIV
jgi:hypothetical protein